MGYRTYIGSLNKTEYNKIKDMSLDELMDYKCKDKDPDDRYIGVYDICDKELCEFGKYTEFDDAKYYTDVFTNIQTNEHFTDEHDFWIVGKDFLALIIEHYRKRVAKMYEDLLVNLNYRSKSKFLDSIKTEPDKNDFLKDKYSADFSLLTSDELHDIISMINHVRSMGTEWLQLDPYNLEKGDEITTSWKYEYSIFELVRIYKHFDWDNNVMIYYGY